MNKAQLIEALSERLGDKKTAGAAVDGLVDVIVRTVNGGEKVNITGFGVFEKRARAARTARNPRTGETVKVKKTNVPAFRAGTNFKEVISGAKKLPRVDRREVHRRDRGRDGHQGACDHHSHSCGCHHDPRDRDPHGSREAGRHQDDQGPRHRRRPRHQGSSEGGDDQGEHRQGTTAKTTAAKKPATTAAAKKTTAAPKAAAAKPAAKRTTRKK